jgi:hypothetical protein
VSSPMTISSSPRSTLPYRTLERADPESPEHDRRRRHECTLRNPRPVPVEHAKKRFLQSS